MTDVLSAEQAARSRETRISAAVHIGSDGAGWLPTVINLRSIFGDGLSIATADDLPVGPFESTIRSSSIESTLRALADDTGVEWIVVAGEPCLVSVDLLDRLSTFRDERIASVSFLSNAAGPLSFPVVGTEVPRAAAQGPQEMTARLRTMSPLPRPIPVPIAAGPLIAFAAPIVRMLPGEWSRECDGWTEAVAAYSLTAQARGLTNVLDAATFVHRATDLRVLRDMSPRSAAVLDRRFPWRRTAVEAVITDPNSAMRLEHRVARAKIFGLDLLLDGSCLGPTEMGTQVGLISIAAELARREDVSSVAIALPHDIPVYARHLLTDPRISLVKGPTGGPIETDRRFDIGFRPFQPDGEFDSATLRAHAERVVVSILDLIAYQNPSYFRSGVEWAEYRQSINSAARRVDAVITISDDVVNVLADERLAIDPGRVHVVPYGTEHLNSLAPSRMPAVFANDPASRFMVVLGTNYGHKNRDVAIRALAVLRRRGHDLRLVLAGAAVPYGSTRALEAEAELELSSNDVVALYDVVAEERNWLLAHAEVVLYPTSAEGFGLVPFEAAWLGTPTLFVPFGPLAAIGKDLPVAARDWTPIAFADEVEKLLRDPAVGEQQVARLLEASSKFTWARTAESLCDVFRLVLSRPPVEPPIIRGGPRR